MSGEQFNTIFPAKPCPRCKETVQPETTGKTSEMHGHQVRCPSCSWVWWGGKLKIIKPKEEKRAFSTQWPPSRLGIDYCQLCLRPKNHLGTNETLHSHHLIRIEDGGPDEPKNILVVCTACHKLIDFIQLYFNKHLLPFFEPSSVVEKAEDEVG